jgi:hypothetical protein
MLSVNKFLALLRPLKCKCLKTLALIVSAVHTPTCCREKIPGLIATVHPGHTHSGMKHIELTTNYIIPHREKKPFFF